MSHSGTGPLLSTGGSSKVMEVTGWPTLHTDEQPGGGGWGGLTSLGKPYPLPSPCGMRADGYMLPQSPPCGHSRKYSLSSSEATAGPAQLPGVTTNVATPRYRLPVFQGSLSPSPGPCFQPPPNRELTVLSRTRSHLETSRGNLNAVACPASSHSLLLQGGVRGGEGHEEGTQGREGRRLTGAGSVCWSPWFQGQGRPAAAPGLR